MSLARKYRIVPTSSPWVSEDGEDGARLFDGERLLIFVAWHDHFSDTSSAHKYQYNLFIDIKSWS